MAGSIEEAHTVKEIEKLQRPICVSQGIKLFMQGVFDSESTYTSRDHGCGFYSELIII
jgi:hypothetical protein